MLMTIDMLEELMRLIIDTEVQADNELMQEHHINEHYGQQVHEHHELVLDTYAL
jgi:hypothetical protein